MGDHGLLKHTLIVGGTSILALALNYVFYAIIGRTLPPAQYAVFATLQSFFFIVFIIGQIMNVILMQHISFFESRQQRGKVRELFTYTLRLSMIIGAAIILAFALVSNGIAEALELPSSAVLPIFLLGLQIASFLVLSGVYGMLTGLERYAQLGLNRIINAAAALVLGIALLPLGVSGIILAFTFANIVGLPSGIRFLADSLKVRRLPIGKTGLKKVALNGLLVSFLIGALANIAVILAKLFLPAHEAGLFAAAAFIGQIPFFISATIVTTMFPKVSALVNEGKHSAHIFRGALRYLCYAAAPLLILTLFFPRLSASILFSGDYTISGFLGLAALSGVILAFANLFALYLLGTGVSKVWRQLLFGIVLEITLISIFHASAVWIVLDTLVANMSILTWLYLKNRHLLANAGRADPVTVRFTTRRISAALRR